MTLFNLGPDGFLLLESLLVSALVAVLAWRRVDVIAGISATLAAAIAIVAFNYRSLNGPVLFVGCYVGICELCVKAGVI